MTPSHLTVYETLTSYLWQYQSVCIISCSLKKWYSLGSQEQGKVGGWASKWGKLNEKLCPEVLWHLYIQEWMISWLTAEISFSPQFSLNMHTFPRERDMDRAVRGTPSSAGGGNREEKPGKFSE